jgi:hypothetical protein
MNFVVPLQIRARVMWPSVPEQLQLWMTASAPSW